MEWIGSGNAPGCRRRRIFDPETEERLITYACELNLAYFVGDLSEIPALDPDGELQRTWEENRSSFSGYFASLVPEIGANYTLWSREGPRS